MDQNEREILRVLDAAVRSRTDAIEPVIAGVARKLRQNTGDVLAWEAIPLECFGTHLPDPIRSSWVFVLRANVVTGAERHPNSHQRMMSFRGHGDFQTKPASHWISHRLTSDPSSPPEERWISIPPNEWHQGVVGPTDWVVISFHTVPEHELIEERPAIKDGETVQRRYSPGR